jgi:hypothetical protein
VAEDDKPGEETQPPDKERRRPWLPSPEDKKQFGRLAAAAMTTVAALSGVAQFVGLHAKSWFQSLIISTAVVGAGCLAIALFVLLWKSIGRSVSMTWPKLGLLLTASFAAGILGGAGGLAIRGGNADGEKASPRSPSAPIGGQKSGPAPEESAPPHEPSTNPSAPQAEAVLFDDFHEGRLLESRWTVASLNDADPLTQRQIYVVTGKLHLQVTKDNSRSGANAYLSPVLPERKIKSIVMKMALVSQEGGSEGAAYLIVASAQGREHRIFLGPGMGSQPVAGIYVCRSGTCEDKEGAKLAKQMVIPKNKEFDVTVEVTRSSQLRLSVDGYPAVLTLPEPDPLATFKLYLYSDPKKTFDVSVDDIRISYA